MERKWKLPFGFRVKALGGLGSLGSFLCSGFRLRRFKSRQIKEFRSFTRSGLSTSTLQDSVLSPFFAFQLQFY